MATKGLKPMGEGMYKLAGGSFSYDPPLPGTNTEFVCNDDGEGGETPVTDSKYKTKSP